MTDQTPANLTRKEARAVREWAERAWSTKVQDAVVAHAARVLLAVLPPRPTLADMAEEERAACRWMQADIIGGDEPLVIARIDRADWSAVILDRNGRYDEVPAGAVTPRPDLPRMTWPGDTPALAAPALPDGWRLADHKDNGRVIVTNTTPARYGRVYYVLPSAADLGFDWLFCDPDMLTYIDQEADTAATVPESTLAVGSVWEGARAFSSACREAGLDKVVVADNDGDVDVWDVRRGRWICASSTYRFAPFTILHAGRKVDQ